jgi:hypothetical protein
MELEAVVFFLAEPRTGVGGSEEEESSEEMEEPRGRLEPSVSPKLFWRRISRKYCSTDEEDSV